MNPVLSKIILIASLLAVVCIAAYSPEWLSDKNAFLKNFINHEYLNTLGVILAITLASLSQLHLAIGRMERKLDQGVLDHARSEIKSSAVHLIVCFIMGLLLVLLKPLIVFGIAGEAILNGLSVVILIYYILIMADITLSVFDITEDV